MARTEGLSPKVTAAGGTGALTILLVYVLGELGVDIPPEVASAITTLLSLAAGLIAKPGSVSG